MKQISPPDSEAVRAEVRRHYGSIASGQTDLGPSSCCGGEGCTTPAPAAEGKNCCDYSAEDQARLLGYSEADLSTVPDGANLGLGCGNPVAIASLQPGQTVLDLGSGAGFDAFLAARAVGKTGRVIGVDMTPEMVSKARANAQKGGYSQVEFRLGEIECLPVRDATVDVIISNCVINLSPDKRAVYLEAFRVLKPGGRLAVSDVVARTELSAEVKADLALHSACFSGATVESQLQTILEEVGFASIQIKPKGNTEAVINSWEARHGLETQVYAAEVTAVKPAASRT